MNYKCNKCNKLFKQRNELVVHMQRKTPCGIKDNFDIVMQEVDKILNKLEGTLLNTKFHILFKY